MKINIGKTKKHFRWRVLIPLLMLLGFAIHNFTNKTAFQILIDGESMSPTYQDKELVWATSLYSSVARDDIVAVKFDETIIVKRVRFIPGDVFWAIKDDMLRWTPIPDEMVNDFRNLNIWKIKKFTVPNEMLWLEGDNKKVSYDSRIHGFFEFQNIIGVLFPWKANKNNETSSISLNQMQNLKNQGIPITREKFINNVFKS